MSEQESLSGGCLCGAVRFTATPKERKVVACHCGMCRRWTGGIFLAIECGDSMHFDSDADLGIYRSSDWAERGYCKKCGSSLFWRNSSKDQYEVSAQAFDDPGALYLSGEIFIEEKPDYYAFANDTEKMTGAEVFAKFAPQNKDG